MLIVPVRHVGCWQLPPGETLLFATPAWGGLLSRRGGIVTVRRNVVWRVEYRTVGNWRAEPLAEPVVAPPEIKNQQV